MIEGLINIFNTGQPKYLTRFHLFFPPILWVDHGFKKFGDYKERSKLDGGWWEQRLGRFCILEWKCISLLTC